MSFSQKSEKDAQLLAFFGFKESWFRRVPNVSGLICLKQKESSAFFSILTR